MSLQKFYDGCKRIGIFNEKHITDIAQFSNKCTSNLIVIDYDKLKTELNKRWNEKRQQNEDACTCESLEISFDERKSCDALKIVIDKKNIDFIEIKGFDKFVEFRIKNKEDKNEVKKAIKEQIEKFELERKIVESSEIYNDLLYVHELELTNPERMELRKLDKNFILLIDFGDYNDIANKNNAKSVISLATSLKKLTIRAKYEKLLQRIYTKIYEDLEQYMNSLECSVKISEMFILTLDQLEKRYALSN